MHEKPAGSHVVVNGLSINLLPELHREHLIRMQYAAQNAAYGAQYPASDYQIVLRDSVPVGKIWIAAMPDELHTGELHTGELHTGELHTGELHTGELHLVDILIAEPYRNSGVGAYLVKQLQRQAESAQMSVRSTVFRFNEGSVRFHQRLGFLIVGEDEVQFHMEWFPCCLRD